MAANDVVIVDAPDELVKIVCDSCKRSVKTELKCDKCVRQYHPACLVRLKGAKTLGIGQILCPVCAPTLDDNVNKESLKKENDLLNMLVLTLMDSNSLLRDQIAVLEAKNNNLEEKTSHNQFVNKPQPTIPSFCFPVNGSLSESADPPGDNIDKSNVNVAVAFAQTSSRKEEAIRHNRKKSTSKNSYININVNNKNNQENSKESEVFISNTQVHSAVNEAMAQTVLSKYTGASTAATKQTSNNNFKPNRSSQLKSGTRGTAVVADGLFQGVSGKKWLFVGRVADTVTIEVIADYIKQKIDVAGHKTLVVEELPSKSMSKSFKVGIGECYYDVLDDCKFWPHNVIFRPFTFRRKYQATHNVNEPTSNQNF